MLLGLFAALGATVLYGLASVFQARGARHGSPSRAVLSGSFLLGIALDIAGFASSFVALRRLTLFTVQAVTSTSLAVTALAATWLLAVRLHHRDVVALATVCAALVLLAVGSGPEGHTAVGRRFHWGLLFCAVAVVAVVLLLSRLWRGHAVLALGLLTGTSFGLVSVGVRVLDRFTVTALATDPATYTLAVGGLGGYLCYALALQRGSVTAVTAAVIVGETVVPGLIGVVALGDRARPGFGSAAALGFALALVGTFALARFGELPSPATGHTTGGSERAGVCTAVRRWQRGRPWPASAAPPREPGDRRCERDP